MKLKLSYVSGQNRQISKGIKSLLLVIVFFIALLGIGPLIADQMSNNVNASTQSDTSTATVTESDTPTSAVIDTSTISSNSDTSTPSINNESMDSESAVVDKEVPSITSAPSKNPAYAISDQNLVIQIPATQKIDPRATQVTFPALNFYSKKSSFLMVCLVSSRGYLDVSTKGSKDSFSGSYSTLTGDMSSRISISGEDKDVVNLINSQGGLRLKDVSGRPLAGATLEFRMVALSETTDDFSLCNQANSEARWTLSIQALGIDMDTKKNSLNLGEKRK